MKNWVKIMVVNSRFSVFNKRRIVFYFCLIRNSRNYRYQPERRSNGLLSSPW